MVTVLILHLVKVIIQWGDTSFEALTFSGIRHHSVWNVEIMVIIIIKQSQHMHRNVVNNLSEDTT